MNTTKLYTALNRFGYGADSTTPSIKDIDPKSWLIAQLKPYPKLDNPWTSKLAVEQHYRYAQFKKAKKKNQMSQMDDMAKTVSRKDIADRAKSLVNDSIKHNIETTAPFQARLLDFFSNHFSVSYSNLPMIALAPTLEHEAIGPHLVGQFEDMLIAVEQHPAMLVYLNNEYSVGPNSRFVRKRKKQHRGLNENLAREILELHTLGVNAGYTQNDVTELAKGITGWTVSSIKRGEDAGFTFRQATHEPGKRMILNKTYAQSGIDQGTSILTDLARHPKTADHVCSKLAQHFIADVPPENVVTAMRAKWVESNGNLKQILITMLEHQESWSEQQVKLKSPRDLVISACRACNVRKIRPDAFRTLMVLGQTPFGAGSPAGFADNQQAWSGPRSMMSRIEWAEHFSGAVKANPQDIASNALGPTLRPQTLEQMHRAESKRQALAIMLMSPEFQMR